MAEVKVKVTAQNETRTGFQQALNDAKQFGNEATRSVTIDDEAALAPLRKIQQQLRDIQAQARAPIEPATIGAGGEGLATTSVRGSAAIRGLAVDLASATSGAQIFEAIIRRVSTAMGGLVAATAGFAFGSLIRRTLEDAAAGLNEFIDRSQALQQSFSDLSAPTTTFDQLAAKIRTAADEIEALSEANRKLQSGFGFQVADFFTGGISLEEQLLGAIVPGGNLTSRLLSRLQGEKGSLAKTADQEEKDAASNARLALVAAIEASTARELQIARSRTDEEREFLKISAQRAELLEKANRVSPLVGAATAAQLLASDVTKRKDLEESLKQRAAAQERKNEDADLTKEQRLAKERAFLETLNKANFGGATADVVRADTVGRIKDLERQISAEKERGAAAAARGATTALKITGLESVAALEQALESSDGKRIQVIVEALGLGSIEEAQSALQALDAQTRNRVDAAARKERETATSRLASELEQREFSGLSPDEQRAKIAADQAALIAGAESGAISPADAAQRALELQRREDALLGAASGFTGSEGASAFQRVGLATNEFFDTRQKKDPAEAVIKVGETLKRVLSIIEKSEPLVLANSSS
jgi:hypothetical protein